MRHRRAPIALGGFTLIELLLIVAIVSILSAIAIPHLMDAKRRANYSRAVSDSKTAVNQSVVYAGDTSVYPGPTPLATLRTQGYAGVSDTDPWGNPYITLPPLNGNGEARLDDDIVVFSKGPANAGIYNPGVSPPSGSGLGGSVGFSSVYGSWLGT
jgi:type II secretory pathway pseudopilin PulG